MTDSRKILLAILVGIGLFSLLPRLTRSQESLVNWTDKYNLRSLVRVSHRVVDSAGSALVFLRLDLREGLNLANYQFQYGLAAQLNPGEVPFTDLDIDKSAIFQEKGVRVLKINLPSTTSLPVLILKIRNQQEGLDSYFDVILQSPFYFDRSDLSLWVNGGIKPMIRNYLSVSDSIVIRSTKTAGGLAYSYLYRHDFPAADPPVSSSPSAGKQLSIDSVFTLPIGEQITLTKPGLYFIQSDSTSFAGISVFISEDAYPGASSIENLIEPLIYVSTKEETQRLRNAPETKKALDKFLMDLTRSKERAKLFVRHYFRRVSESNRLFTNYKEGWKTDKGMIYILLGIPDLVRPLDDRELWTYNLPNGEVVFSFLRVKSIFSSEHHHLIRDKSYDRIWFGIVDDWRRGKFRF